MNKRIPILLLLSALMVANAFSQKANVDSLENVLKLHSAEDTVKANMLIAIGQAVSTFDNNKMLSTASQALELSERLMFLKGQSESLFLLGLYYKNNDKSQALYYAKRALSIAEKIKYWTGVVRVLNLIGGIYGSLSKMDLALEYYQRALVLSEELNDKLGMAKCYSYIAMEHIRDANYPKAIQYLQKSTKIYEAFDNRIGISSNLSSLGVIYVRQGNYPLSLDCYQKSLSISEELNNKDGISACLNNIGNIYVSQNKSQLALQMYTKALNINNEIGDKGKLSASYLNIGIIYQKLNNPKALEYFETALRYSEEVSSKLTIPNILSSMGDYHLEHKDYPKALDSYRQALSIANEIPHKRYSCKIKYAIGRVYLKQKNYTNALSNSLQSLAIANELKLLVVQKDLHGQLSEIYAATHDYKNAYINHTRYKALNDSLFNETNTQKIAELEYNSKYEKEKQSLELAQQKKDVIQAAAKRQLRIIMLSLIVAFILVSLLAIYVYRSYRIKRKSNILLTQQKQEIETKNDDLVQLNEEISVQREEITAQRDEIEAQRDLVVQQKDHIEAQKEKITDSIDYARHIQQALLPSRAYATANLGEHFILFKPKDVVSGDFYWCTRVNEYLIVTVADCTGHGVPGAFMSMLGISFLNEIVGKKGVVRASDILDQLRKSVVDALQQKWQTGEQKEGMDMALIVINTQTAQLQYAGAQNPLYIVTAGNELKAIKGDNQTVAINIEMKPFTNHEIALSKGDCIYLATDGYHDQFGGPTNKKFKGTQLKDLFVSISAKPMDEQREILDNVLENWRGNGEQIDDVTILGMRV